MRATADENPWSRRRLLRTLAVVATAGALLLGGMAYALYSAISSAHRASDTPAAAVRAAEQLAPGPTRRNAIAAAPMLAVQLDDGRSGTPAARLGPTITIPPAGRAGPEQVPTGFPHTPEGAAGQLAAIEQVVLQSMSIQTAHAVYRAWSADGAPPADTWELTLNVQAFLGSGAGQYADSPTTTIVATPVAAQIKGTDGPDWVVACVLLDVKAQVTTQARIAYGHCERMQWTASHGGRWVIAPGSAPARAPSTWPGTDLARQAGWRAWATLQEQ